MGRERGGAQERGSPYSCGSSIQHDYEREMCEVLRPDVCGGSSSVSLPSSPEESGTSFSFLPRQLPNSKKACRRASLRNERQKIHYQHGRVRVTGCVRPEGKLEKYKHACAERESLGGKQDHAGGSPSGMGDESEHLSEVQDAVCSAGPQFAPPMVALQVPKCGETGMDFDEDPYPLGQEWSWEDEPCQTVTAQRTVLYAPGYLTELQRRVPSGDHTGRSELQASSSGSTDQHSGHDGQQADTLSPLQRAHSEGDLEDYYHELAPFRDTRYDSGSDTEEDPDYASDSSGKGKEKVKVHIPQSILLTDDEYEDTQYDPESDYQYTEQELEEWYNAQHDEADHMTGKALLTAVHTWVDDFNTYCARHRQISRVLW